MQQGPMPCPLLPAAPLQLLLLLARAVRAAVLELRWAQAQGGHAMGAHNCAQPAAHSCAVEQVTGLQALQDER